MILANLIKNSFRSFLLWCGVLFFCSCNSDVPYTSIDGTVQGTTYHIVYQSLQMKNFSGEINAIFLDIDSSFSLYNPSSLVSRINNNDSSARLNRHLKTLINRSMEMTVFSGSLFDITVGPLVRYYGFGNAPKTEIKQEDIDSILQFIGSEKIRIAGDRLIKSDPRITIDLNAIAQGYTVDLIAGFLDSHNVRNYLVEIGGEVRVKGVNPKHEPWRIGIDRPDEGNNSPGTQLQYIVHLNNKALATSGNYRKFYFQNGMKYSHTINPVTGKPEIHHLLSATVVSDDCATADALATCCMLMGLEKSRQKLDEINTDAILIYSSGDSSIDAYITPGLLQLIKKL